MTWETRGKRKERDGAIGREDTVGKRGKGSKKKVTMQERETALNRNFLTQKGSWEIRKR